MVEGRWSFGSREVDEDGDEGNADFGGEFWVSIGEVECLGRNEVTRMSTSEKLRSSALGIRGMRNSPSLTVVRLQRHR